MSEETVTFTKKAVRKYLDDCIAFWRKKRERGGEDTFMNEHYIDAYQSVRISLFGETLPLNDMMPEDKHMPSVLKDVNLEFDEDEGQQWIAKDMMRIGRHLINKDDISYIDLGSKTLSIRIYFRGGHFVQCDDEEVEIIRPWLLKQFPCEEDQTLWLENST